MNFLPFIKKKPALEEAVPTPVEEEVSASAEEVSAPVEKNDNAPKKVSIMNIKINTKGNEIKNLFKGELFNEDLFKDITNNKVVIKEKIKEIAKIYYSHQAKYYFYNSATAYIAKYNEHGKQNMEDAMLGLWILALYQLNKPDSAKKLKGLLLSQNNKFDATKYAVTKPYIEKFGREIKDGKILGPFMTYLGGTEYGGLWTSNSDKKHKPEALEQVFTDDYFIKKIEEKWDATVDTHKDTIIDDADKLNINPSGGRKLKKTLKKKSKKGKKTMKQKGKKSNKKVVKKHKKTMKKKKGIKHKTRKHK